MANPCYNKVIIRHDDYSKIRDLYHVTSGDFFNFIKPYPMELYNQRIQRYSQRTPKDTQYNLEEFGAENLRDWINKNWTSRSPYPDPIERTLSKKGEFLMLRFDTPGPPPIGIYEELERQGYYVRSYFFSPYSCFCGCFINGIGEWYGMNDAKDLPQDIDRMFGVDGFNKSYHSEEGREYPDKCNDKDAEGQCHMC